MHRSFADNWFGNIVAGDSGANVVWDYSQVQATGTDDSLFFFHKTSRTWGNNLGGEVISERSFRRIAQDWWKNSSAGLVMMGSNTVNSQGQYSDFVYSPARVWLPASASYGTRAQSNFTGFVKFFVGHTMGGSRMIDSIRRRSTEWEEMKFDGYGTIKLPTGAQHTVLRQRVKHIINDTADFLVRGQGWLPAQNIDHWEQYEYRYWSPGIPYPVATVLATNGPDNVDHMEWATLVTYPCPKPTVTASGPVTFPLGNSVTLSAPAGYFYLWSNGARTQRITVTSDGSYTVQVITVGCTSVPSDPVVVRVTSPVSFEWNGVGDDITGSNWSSGSLPSATVDSIVINSGSMTLTGNRQFRKIVVRPGAEILLGGYKLTIVEELKNSGTIEGAGELRLEGSRIYGSGTVLVTDFSCNSTPHTIGQPVRITKLLNHNGDISLTPSGSITLASDRASQATIHPGATGVILNPDRFQIERYVEPTGTTGAWFFIGPPVSNYAAGNLAANNMFATGTYDNTVPNASSLYLYDPTDGRWPVNQGFVKAAGPTSFIPDDQGVRVWIRRSRAQMGPLVFNGAPIMNPVSYNLKYCSTGCTYGTTNGFNLIRNPYAAWLDWDARNGWNKNQVMGQIHVWNSALKQYASYVAGVGVNGGTNTIAPGQSFFVSAESGMAQLSVDRRATLADPDPSFLRTGNMPNLLKVKLQDQGSTLDEIAIRHIDVATTLFDSVWDARKISGEGPSISSLDQAGKMLAINSLPVQHGSRVQLQLQDVRPGSLLQVEGLESLTGDRKAYWYHPSWPQSIEITNQPLVLTTPLLSGLAIEFNRVVTNIEDAVSPKLTLRPNPATTSVQLHLTAGSFKGVSIVDQLGRTVLTTTTLNGDLLDISSLAAGTYVVKVSTENGVAVQRMAVVR